MMSRQRLVFALLASLLVLAGSFGGGTAAAAAPDVPGTPTTNQVCNARAVPRGSQEAQPPIECFATRAEADRAVTRMRTTAYYSELGWFWIHPNGQGAWLRIFGDSCYDTRNLAGSGWDNAISSAEFFCGSGGTMFDGYQSGDRQYYAATYYGYVGDFMNDRITSIQFYP